jgi:hypothetical protein
MTTDSNFDFDAITCHKCGQPITYRRYKERSGEWRWFNGPEPSDWVCGIEPLTVHTPDEPVPEPWRKGNNESAHALLDQAQQISNKLRQATSGMMIVQPLALNKRNRHVAIPDGWNEAHEIVTYEAQRSRQFAEDAERSRASAARDKAASVPQAKPGAHEVTSDHVVACNDPNCPVCQP